MEEEAEVADDVGFEDAVGTEEEDGFDDAAGWDDTVLPEEICEHFPFFKQAKMQFSQLLQDVLQELFFKPA